MISILQGLCSRMTYGDKDFKNDFDRFGKMIQDTIQVVVIVHRFRVQRLWVHPGITRINGNIEDITYHNKLIRDREKTL